MELENNRFLTTSKATREEIVGKIISYLCIGFVVLLVGAILYFITSHGIATFTKNHISPLQFFTSSDWSPTQKTKAGLPRVGALAMIVTSFGVTILAAIFATPFAIATAVFMTELAPKKGAKLLQSALELLVGIPSVVYGFIGLTVLVPIMRKIFGGTGFGVLSGSIVLFVMILPTVSSLAVSSLKAVPMHYRQASLALGATRWQTTYKVLLPVATPGLLTAVIFGMSRAFGEALAVQMVIGNAVLLPHNLTTPASTLTSQLTTEIGNTILGTLPNNALWSLSLVLLFMSLVFNLAVQLIGKKGGLR
jgi:phosphate transport system permease protein